MRRETSFRRDWKLSVYPALTDVLSNGEVTIRLPVKADSAQLATYATDINLLDGSWVGWPSEEVEIELWANHCVDEWLRGWTQQGSDLGPSFIVDAGEPFVGIIGLMPLSVGTVELLYGVLPTARRRGIASQAVLLATEWVFSSSQYQRIELRISEANIASQRVAENAGFQIEEKFETFVTGTGETHIDLLYGKHERDRFR